MSSPAGRLFLVAVIAALLSACSLAGDVTPPPGSRPQVVATAALPTATSGPAPTVAPQPTDTGLGFPLAKPSAAEGAVLYADHCAACHGQRGQGDGPMSPQLPAPPPDFSAPETARAALPANWFQNITEGNLDRLMPPFSDRLTEAERWDLVAFLYTLSTPPERIEIGEAVYAANCARCHGEGGAGDGPEAQTLTGRLSDLAQPDMWAARSQSDWFSTVADGVGQAMPGFSASLSEGEVWAVVDYVRALGYEYAAPSASQAETIGTVIGNVVNGTSGAPLPADLQVLLHGFDAFTEVTTLTATVDSSGGYIFENVPIALERQFVVSAEHQGVVYGSEIGQFAPDAATLQLPIAIYDATSDAASLRVERMHVFFDFAAGQVTVGQLYIVSNDGDRTVLKPEGTLEFPLPPGAANLDVQGEEEGIDFVLTAQGLADLTPVRPGQGTAQILFSFSLPYERKLDFEQKVLYPVDSVNVLVPDLGVKLKGGNLQDLGAQSIQGTTFQNYMGGGLAAGESIAFQLAGSPAGTAEAAAPADATSIAIGAGSLGAALLGVGYWWYRRSRLADGEAETLDREALLQAIADLDDAFDKGEIGEREYERKRARLKAKL